MKEEIGVDFDGTGMNYHHGMSPGNSVNRALLRVIAGKAIWVLTNQGGLPFGVRQLEQPSKLNFPQPYEFSHRLRIFEEVCRVEFDITVKGVRASLFHPKIAVEYIMQAADNLSALALNLSIPLYVFTTAKYRKPLPEMFWGLSLARYYGDSEEDQQAAESAGVPFTQVERFMGSVLGGDQV